MILLNPKQHQRPYPDARSTEVMRATIGFFESKGKEKLLADYYSRVWYADFLEFVKANRIFATMCTPAGEGAEDARWDTWRICEFAEILGFYGLQYWYTWQVSVLGLGPLWMSKNQAITEPYNDVCVYVYYPGTVSSALNCGTQNVSMSWCGCELVYPGIWTMFSSGTYYGFGTY